MNDCPTISQLIPSAAEASAAVGKKESPRRSGKPAQRGGRLIKRKRSGLAERLPPEPPSGQSAGWKNRILPLTDIHSRHSEFNNFSIGFSQKQMPPSKKKKKWIPWETAHRTRLVNGCQRKRHSGQRTIHVAGSYRGNGLFWYLKKQTWTVCKTSFHIHP